MSTPSKAWLPLFIAVCLVAINLRMTITGVGPLLDDIAVEQGVSPAALGALASIPLLVWAVVSPLAQALADRMGLDAAVGWSLVVLMAATVWRSIPGSALNLWLGTALIGAALAITNVLLPAVIKRGFGSRVPLVMGVYSALIGVSGALGAAIVAPIAHFETGSQTELGWRWALLATAATVPIALAVWVWASRRAASGLPRSGIVRSVHSSVRRVWFDRVAWCVALYMGSQSWVFYIHATWIAPIDLSRGADPVTAGFHVTYFHIFGMAGSLLTSFLARGQLARIMPALVPILSLVGSIGIVYLPAALPLWLALAGLACGISLSLALVLIAQRSPDTATAGAVSGMAQSFGYLLAAGGPILFGWFFGLSGSWELPLVAILIGIALQFGAGLVLLRGRLVFAPK